MPAITLDPVDQLRGAADGAERADGWLERRERETLAYLIEQNRLLRRQLGRRLRLTDDDRRRLAALELQVRARTTAISKRRQERSQDCIVPAAYLGSDANFNGSNRTTFLVDTDSSSEP